MFTFIGIFKSHLKKLLELSLYSVNPVRVDENTIKFLFSYLFFFIKSEIF